MIRGFALNLSNQTDVCTGETHRFGESRRVIPRILADLEILPKEPAPEAQFEKLRRIGLDRRVRATAPK
jgi:hypothetical protein